MHRRRRGSSITHAYTRKQRVDCVNKLCGSYCIPIILDAHVFPQSLTQHTVSMPEWRVCKTGNEWGRKPCWIQYMQPIQIHSKPFRTIASVNTPDGTSVRSKIVLFTYIFHICGFFCAAGGAPAETTLTINLHLQPHSVAHSYVTVNCCKFRYTLHTDTLRHASNLPLASSSHTCAHTHACTQRISKHARKHSHAVHLRWHWTTTHLGTYTHHANP